MHTPPPGSYSIGSIFSQKRFSAGIGRGNKDPYHSVEFTRKNPGPDRYSTRSLELSTIQRSRAYAFPKINRFKYIDSMKGTPGPGGYSIKDVTRKKGGLLSNIPS